MLLMLYLCFTSMMLQFHSLFGSLSAPLSLPVACELGESCRFGEI